MDREPEVKANTHSPRLERHRHTIEFRNVCFSYEPGRPILTNVHLHDIRAWSKDEKHHKVDDRPFGGGPGLEANRLGSI